MNFKKIVLLFCSFLVLLYIKPVFAGTIANDISEHWAEKTILKWQKENKIKGYEDGTFRPNQTITRAEFVQLLYPIFTADMISSPSFIDVQKQDWFYSAVCNAVSNHITNGFEDNTFRPHEKITRAQAAVMLANGLKLSENVQAANKLSDAETLPHWAKGSVGAMIEFHYLSGYEDGSFLGENYLTRAEAVSMLERISSATINQTIPLPNTIVSSQKEKGNMVWQKGGSNSSTNEEKQDSYQTITNETASNFTGQTIYDTAKIKMDTNDLALEDITFYGDVEVISSAVSSKPNTIPKLSLKGDTAIHKTLTISTPVVIEAEQNHINTVVSKAETTFCGNADISSLQTNAALDIGKQTSINTLQILPNTTEDIIVAGQVDTITAKEQGVIETISLTDDTHPDMIVPKNITVKTLMLLDNTQPSITVQKYGEIEQIVSFSSSSDTKVFNHGAIDSILALHPQTILADNATIAPLVLQNISILTQPKTLHYKQGDMLSLQGISLLLEYQNDITKIINNPEEFTNYCITTSPQQGETISETHQNKPIVIQSGNIMAFTEPLTVDCEISFDTAILQQLISQCKTALESVVISQTGIELPMGQKWVTKEVFFSLKNALTTAENTMSNSFSTPLEMQKQYNILLSVLQSFTAQIHIVKESIEAPLLSVSDNTPEYGAENVTVTIENKKEDVLYYYTINGDIPNPEDNVHTKLYEKPIVLSPPKETSQTSIVIKVIGIKGNLSSAVTEETITYSAASPIQKGTLYQLQAPMPGKNPSDMLYCDQSEPYFIDEKPTWKDENNTTLNETDVFQPNTSYTAYFCLKSKKPYIFTKDTSIDIKTEGIKQIVIDTQRSDTDYLFVAVYFDTTPPLPTQQQAEEILKEISNYILFSPIEVNQKDFQEDEVWINQMILSSIEQFIPNYWDVTVEIDTIHTFSEMAVVSAKFTVQSQLNDTITVSNEYNIDITILLIT